ncbi:MAG: hypothetical protein IPJ58_07220 [Ardenticatenia bacterium]|nr:hypothetical protein [Ardenticatenia bacterium]
MNLSKANFDRAAAFVRAHARDLDRSLFEHEFAGGSSRAVLAALIAYQNADGGCGQPIEPEFRRPASSCQDQGQVS